VSKPALRPLERLVGEIKTLIEQSRQQVAVTVNATMTIFTGRSAGGSIRKKMGFAVNR